MSTISVLMPVYNTKEEYLRLAIESILTQTFKDFEFLIINDGSTDNKVKDIILSYNDSRIKYKENDINLGISRTRNELLDWATGEFLAIMDHDDISLPERFKKQLAFMEAHPDYGVCGSWHGFINSKVISKRPVSNLQIHGKLRKTQECPLHHPCTMIRKSVLNNNDIRYEEAFTPAEDYALWCRLYKKTKMYNIPEVLFMYRDFDNTTHSQFDKLIKAAKCAGILLLGKEWKDVITELQPNYRNSRTIISFFGLPLVLVRRKMSKTTLRLLGFIPFISWRNK